ncbi:MAG: hypothetical protein WA874_09690 [Chryseosolibacter sp.]
MNSFVSCPGFIIVRHLNLDDAQRIVYAPPALGRDHARWGVIT